MGVDRRPGPPSPWLLGRGAGTPCHPVGGMCFLLGGWGVEHLLYTLTPLVSPPTAHNLRVTPTRPWSGQVQAHSGRFSRSPRIHPRVSDPGRSTSIQGLGVFCRDRTVCEEGKSNLQGELGRWWNLGGGRRPGWVGRRALGTLESSPLWLASVCRGRVPSPLSSGAPMVVGVGFWDNRSKRLSVCPSGTQLCSEGQAYSMKCVCVCPAGPWAMGGVALTLSELGAGGGN